MWTGTLKLGQLHLGALAAALPELVESWRQIQFDGGGIAIINDQLIGGLQLIAGRHFETDATYAITVDDGEAPQALVLLTIGEVSSDRLELYLTSGDSKERIDQRWELFNPADPTRLRLSYVQGKQKATSHVFDFDVDLRELANPQSESITLSATLERGKGWLSMRQQDLSSLAYRAGLADDPNQTGGLQARIKESTARRLSSIWLQAAVAILRHIAATEHGDPSGILGSLTIDRIAVRPDRRIQKKLGKLLPVAT